MFKLDLSLKSHRENPFADNEKKRAKENMDRQENIIFFSAFIMCAPLLVVATLYGVYDLINYLETGNGTMTSLVDMAGVTIEEELRPSWFLVVCDSVAASIAFFILAIVLPAGILWLRPKRD